MYVRAGEPGASDSNSRVAEKCGEERWKLTFRNSLLSLRVKEAMAQAISFCCSGRVLMMSGCRHSNFQPPRLEGVLRLLRAIQRKLFTCRENVGGKSRSAWKVTSSRRLPSLLKSHCTGVCWDRISTSTHAF